MLTSKVIAIYSSRAILYATCA